VRLYNNPSAAHELKKSVGKDSNPLLQIEPNLVAVKKPVKRARKVEQQAELADYSYSSGKLPPIVQLPEHKTYK